MCDYRMTKPRPEKRRSILKSIRHVQKTSLCHKIQRIKCMTIIPPFVNLHVVTNRQTNRTWAIVCVVLLSGVDDDVDDVDMGLRLAQSLLDATRGAYYRHLPDQPINARLSVHIGEYDADVDLTPSLVFNKNLGVVSERRSGCLSSPLPLNNIRTLCFS